LGLHRFGHGGGLGGCRDYGIARLAPHNQRACQQQTAKHHAHGKRQKESRDIAKVSAPCSDRDDRGPVGNRWGLASPTSFSAFAQRVDEHMVIIGLSMDVSKGTAVARAPVLPLATGRSALQKSSVASPAEQSALDAVRQAKIDAYLDRAAR
jgi:hypothetical protein